MSKSIRAKVRSQQAYNAEKIGNKPGLPPRIGKSLHSFLLLNKVNANCGCKSYADTVAPTIVSAKLLVESSVPKGYIITFSEDLFGNTLLTTNFSVTHNKNSSDVDGNTEVWTRDTVTTAEIKNGKLEIKTTNQPQSPSTLVKLFYKSGEKGTATNLKDKFGNEVASTTTDGTTGGHSFAGNIQA